MTCKECGQVVKLTRTMNKCHSNTELSSLEEILCTSIQLIAYLRH